MMNDIHKLTREDVDYITIKAALGSIPVLGAAATELFGLVVTPPLEGRRQKWMNDIADRITKLEEDKKLDFSTLNKNEQFLDTILQATSYAIKTSEAEKIAALKNAVINTALGEVPEKSKTDIFLGLIDRFTPLHLKIVAYNENPRKWFENSRLPPKKPPVIISLTFFHAFPELEKHKELISLIWREVGTAGLITYHEINLTPGVEQEDSTLMPRLTELGKEFMRFISEH